MQQETRKAARAVTAPRRRPRPEDRRPDETTNEWATRLLLDDQLRRNLH